MVRCIVSSTGYGHTTHASRSADHTRARHASSGHGMGHVMPCDGMRCDARSVHDLLRGARHHVSTQGRQTEDTGTSCAGCRVLCRMSVVVCDGMYMRHMLMPPGICVARVQPSHTPSPPVDMQRCGQHCACIRHMVCVAHGIDMYTHVVCVTCTRTLSMRVVRMLLPHAACVFTRLPVVI